jgi:hypothetical protein
MSTNTNNTNKGFYWDAEKWEITLTKPTSRNVKIPTLFMLVLCPLMGSLLVITLPFIGFILLGQHLGVLAFNGLTSIIVPKIALGRAYFINRKHK